MNAKVSMLIPLLLLPAGISYAQTDGSIVVRGWNLYGQCDVPAPNQDFVAVACGYAHSLGLREDSTIVAWGNNDHGQCDVPEPNEGFMAIAAGGFYWEPVPPDIPAHSIGLKSDSSVVCWGLMNTDSALCQHPTRTSLGLHVVAFIALV